MAVTYQKHLEAAGHNVTLHDGFAILKEFLARKETNHTYHLTKYQTDLREAEIVGIGSYVSHFTIAEGVADVLSEEASPTAHFASMKYYFSFTSCGGFPGTAGTYLASYLHSKNANAKYLGTNGFIAPDNCIPYQALRGTYDAVRDSELKKIDDFGKSLVSSIETGTFPPMHQIENSTTHEAGHKPTTRFGAIKLNPDVCIGCYKCVTVCPYNALSKPEKDAKAKIPIWTESSCVGCGRCFNHCSVRAIEFPKMKSEKMEQVLYGTQKKSLKRRHPTTMIEMMGRAMLPRGHNYVLYILAIILVIFILFKLF
ncbi:hypothetical protein BLNAU_17330 [Blattamonas nauphoetae]|uniref:4Fe-4S ferredoxin-type domain-containing protein n=1 Tax=Blattamonas nauphoetae TaxID=2049346 RepID=A0ABQ9X970_9EUKA|nr:hypothetical protein BLNAU_17330 [Blattamonas nauphoetae]